MKRISYWDEFTAAWQWQGERKLVNSVIAEAESEITSVDLRVQAMARELVQLRTIVSVLVSTLRDLNVIDSHLLDVRMQAALEEALGTAPAANPDDPNLARVAICARCRDEVDRASATMTPDGFLCARCASL